MYFATRSLLDGAPVLIWQVFSATARSAIVVSAVSPERCEEGPGKKGKEDLLDAHYSVLVRCGEE